MGIATSGNHEIRLGRSHVQSTGPWRPARQSIHSGRIDCVVDLIERSLTTLDSVCNRPEFEGTKFKSKDTMGFADEEYPGMKGDALLRLLPNLAVE